MTIFTSASAEQVLCLLTQKTQEESGSSSYLGTAFSQETTHTSSWFDQPYNTR